MPGHFAPEHGSGSGSELYVVIGHAPRHLDRNVTLAGRVLRGMERLSTLPRGTGALGFYEKAEQRVPMVSIKAFIKVLPGHAPGEELARRIQAHVKSRLAAHEYPREIEFIEDFPATVTGKIRRRELREAELRKRQDSSGDGQ